MTQAVTQAVAHGEMAGGQSVVRCDSTGQGIIVTLSGDGVPVTHWPCQHCLAATTPADPADPLLVARPRPLPRPADRAGMVVRHVLFAL